MAGITQKICMALIPLWSLKKNFLFLFLGGGDRADVNQEKLPKKNNQSLNLIRSHVSIMTTATVIIISLIRNIIIAIIV